MKLVFALMTLGFAACTADLCLFVRGREQYQSIMLGYVDDFLLTVTEMEDICKGLQEEFKLTSLGEACQFLQHGSNARGRSVQNHPLELYL